MATAKPFLSAKPPTRLGRRAALLFAALALGALVWFWRPLSGHAKAVTSYGAHVACSCRFIAGRSLASCGSDVRPGFPGVTLSDDETERSVSARYLLLWRQTARYRAGEGCMLEKWSG